MMVVIFAMLVGLGGAYAVRNYLQQPAVEEVKAPEPIRIPVAAYDMKRGRQLAGSDLYIVTLTPEEYKQSRYATGGYMSNARQLAGRVLQQPVKRGDPILPTALYPEGTGPGIADLLEPGQLAVTIPVHNVGLVSGFVRPGAIVDVLFRTKSAETGSDVTMTLLERVEVLAVGNAALPDQPVKTPQNGTGMATLAVSPIQAKALRVAEGRGDMTLALRSPNDAAVRTTITESERVTLEQILGVTPLRGQRMEVFAGTQRQVVEFVSRPAADPRNLIGTPVAADGSTPRTIQTSN